MIWIIYFVDVCVTITEGTLLPTRKANRAWPSQESLPWLYLFASVWETISLSPFHWFSFGNRYHYQLSITRSIHLLSAAQEDIAEPESGKVTA